MGNRAIIKTKSGRIGMYLHWNGGRDSVEAFLEYCKLRGFRPPEVDGYGWARLAQVVGNYFGGGLSVGIVETTGDHDGEWCDNGAYVIENWEIVGREDFDGPEQKVYPLEKMLHDIDDAQPESERLGEYLDAEEIPVSELTIGDTVVFWQGGLERMVRGEVRGIGEPWQVVNGHNVSDVPYVNLYGDSNGDFSNNINNYLFQETVRVLDR